jgi:hypothetical protein
MRRVLHGKNLQYSPARRFKNNGKAGYESRRYISAFSENNNVGQAWVSGERWGGEGWLPVQEEHLYSGEMSVCAYICSEQLTLPPSSLHHLLLE